MDTAVADSSEVKHGRILTVEDDLTTRMVLTNLLEDLNYDVSEAENGREALDYVDKNSEELDVIVMDKQMPEMDGLDVVRQLKNEPRFSRIPVVMVTGLTKPEEIRDGLDAGVFYYLTKPFEDDVFKSVIESAMREAERRSTLKSELKKHQSSFGFINKAEFTIKTLDDAEDLACFIANCFPKPETALPGLANLMVNAVEHGNLEIGYEEKTRLLKEGSWRNEIYRRENLPENEDKVVKVFLFCEDNEVRTVIRDEGNGFDWANYMEIDPSRALHNNGRGVAQANKISFDELSYNDVGNEVTAISYKGAEIEW